MIARHLALLVPALAVLALTGCDTRTKKAQEPTAAPAPAASDAQLRDLEAENAALQSQLDEARKRLEESKGGDLAGDVKAISGGEIEGFERTSTGGVALPDDFAFAKGSATLNEAGEKAVARLAARLNEGDNAGSAITVVGHTDSSPVSRPSTKEKFGDNWGLSAARAAAVVRALEKNNIDPRRMHGGFRGEHQPRIAVAASDKGSKHEDDHAANRRVEIYLAK
jgi:flagellar motor protein MotB